jgi:hypothetical protein
MIDQVQTKLRSKIPGSDVGLSFFAFIQNYGKKSVLIFKAG